MALLVGSFTASCATLSPCTPTTVSPMCTTATSMPSLSFRGRVSPSQPVHCRIPTINPGLPYFKFLKKQNRERGRDKLGRPEFARLQREALENYLIGLVRAVVSCYITFPARCSCRCCTVRRCSTQRRTGSHASSRYLRSPSDSHSPGVRKPRRAFYR